MCCIHHLAFCIIDQNMTSWQQFYSYLILVCSKCNQSIKFLRRFTSKASDHWAKKVNGFKEETSQRSAEDGSFSLGWGDVRRVSHVCHRVESPCSQSLQQHNQGLACASRNWRISLIGKAGSRRLLKIQRRLKAPASQTSFSHAFFSGLPEGRNEVQTWIKRAFFKCPYMGKPKSYSHVICNVRMLCYGDIFNNK